jgi:HAD superfamily hydrolase (TIGR01450 family)
VTTEPIDFQNLIDRHEAVLFDAYGVLVHAGGVMPGAAEAVRTLRRRDQPFLVVTNDASRSPQRSAQRYRRLGLEIDLDQVLTCGMLIGPALERHGIAKGRVVVIGTADSAQYAHAVGAQVVAPTVADPADAVVIADEGGALALGLLDEVLSMILAACRAGRPPVLLLANPDLIYPAGGGAFGFTAGSIAGMIERALALVLGSDAPHFELLGKPSPWHFTAALDRIGTRNAVMLGDTLHTDIAGAHGVGIASALLLTGVTTAAQLAAAQAAGHAPHIPTYLLSSLHERSP